MAIEIYCDAGSNLYPPILKKKNLNIHVLSMSLDVAGKTYHCYEDDIDIKAFSKSFYKDIKENKKVTTTLINPYRFMEAFEEEFKKGNDVICFTMAKGISGTYQAACMAKNELDNKYPDRKLAIIDSRTAGFGEGLQAIHAYELCQKETNFDEIVKNCNDFVLKVRSEFTVDNIKYLARTGRVSSIVARLARLLNIKVMLKGSDESKIVSTGKVQGRKMSIKSLAKTCLQNIVNPDEQTIYIAHCDDIEAANKLKELLVEGGIKESVIEIYDYDVVTGAHVGPGALAIFYVGNNRN